MWTLRSLLALVSVAFAAGALDVGVIDVSKKDKTPTPPSPTPLPATPFPSQSADNWEAFNKIMADLWIGIAAKATTLECGAFQIYDLTADEIVGPENVTVALVWNKLSFECRSDTNSSLEVAINMTMVWDTVAFPRIGDCQLTTCQTSVVSYKAEGIFKNKILEDFEKKILPILCTTLAKKTNVIGTLMEIIGKLLPDTPNAPIPRPPASIAEKKFAPFYGDLVKLDLGAAQFATRILTFILNLKLYGMPVIDIILQKLPSVLIPIGEKISLWNIPYLDDIVRMNVTINSFKISGLDTIAGIDLIDIIGDYTIRNKINMTDVSFELSLDVEYGPGKMVQVHESESELEFVKDTVNVTVALKDAYLMIDLLMAFDRESMMNTAISGFKQRPMACIFGMLAGAQSNMPVGFNFTYIDIQLGGLEITHKSGNPGWDEVLNTLSKALGDIWNKPLGRAIRPLLQSTIRPLITEVIVDLISMSQSSDMCPAPGPQGSSNVAKTLLDTMGELKDKQEVALAEENEKLEDEPVEFAIDLMGFPVNVSLKSFTSTLLDEPENATVAVDVGVDVADSIVYPVHVELSFLREGIDRLPYNVTTQEDTFDKQDITGKIQPKLKAVSDIINGLREEMRYFVQTPSSTNVSVQEGAFLNYFKEKNTVIKPLREIMDDVILMDIMSINEIVSYFLIHGIPKIPEIANRYADMGFPISVKNGSIIVNINDKINIPLPKELKHFFSEMTVNLKTVMIALPTLSLKDLAIPEFSYKGDFTLGTILKKVNTNFTIEYDLEVSPGPNATGFGNNTIWSDTLSLGLKDTTLDIDTRIAYNSASFDSLSLYAMLFTPMPCMFSPIALDVNITKASASGKIPFKINDIASGLSITSIQRTAGEVYVKSLSQQPIFGNMTVAVAEILTATLGMTMVEAVANVGLFLTVGAGVLSDLLWDPCFVTPAPEPTARPTYIPGPAPGSAAATIPSVVLLALLLVMLLL